MVMMKVRNDIITDEKVISDFLDDMEFSVLEQGEGIIQLMMEPSRNKFRKYQKHKDAILQTLINWKFQGVKDVKLYFKEPYIYVVIRQ